MSVTRIGKLLSLMAICMSGCIDLDVNVPEALIPTGTSFVLSGTAAVVDNNGPCLVWLGDNGITYHLFQDPRLDNDLFDAITNPGTTSRLELAVRTDLEITCEIGTVVEVQDVLEIVG